MLGSGEVDETEEEETVEAGKQKKGHIDIAITPFAIPIICGPCCITGVITFQSEAVGVAQYLAGLLAITALSAAVCGILVGCAHGAKWLTKPVLRLSYKLSGLILAALAVEMVVAGLRHEEMQVLPAKQATVVVVTPGSR
jgi:multiple antibiotic resistance protein